MIYKALFIEGLGGKAALAVILNMLV